MSFKSLQFVFIVVLVCLALTLLCSLGFWQLSRAKTKEAISKQRHDALKREAFTLKNLLEEHSPQQKRFQSVLFQSKVLNDKIILLDNQVYNGQAGYDVLVPAELNQDSLILINRGWVPLGKNRMVLPSISPISGNITIEGYLDFAYLNPLIKQSMEQEVITWPLRVQQVDLNVLSNAIGKKIYPMLVVLNADSPYAFKAHIPKKNEMTATRHVGYAVQWFGLATALLIWFFYFAYKSNKTI